VISCKIFRPNELFGRREQLIDRIDLRRLASLLCQIAVEEIPNGEPVVA